MLTDPCYAIHSYIKHLFAGRLPGGRTVVDGFLLRVLALAAHLDRIAGGTDADADAT